MNWKLRNHQQVPPRGYKWVDPDTGALIEANSYDQWLSRVADHRRGNNLPPVDPLVLEDQLCSKLGTSAAQFCESTDPAARAVQGVTLDWRDIVRGTATIAAFKLAGSPLVSQEEANRRASICSNCHFNVPFVKPCGGICGELAEVVTAIVGGARLDQELNACAVCSCALQAKAWVPLDILRKYESKEISAGYPAHCWMKK